MLYVFTFLTWKILLNAKPTCPDLVVQCVLAQNKTRRGTVGARIEIWSRGSTYLNWGSIRKVVIIGKGAFITESLAPNGGILLRSHLHH